MLMVNFVTKVIVIDQSPYQNDKEKSLIENIKRLEKFNKKLLLCKKF